MAYAENRRMSNKEPQKSEVKKRAKIQGDAVFVFTS
jgi:hypothetical protein